MTAQQLVPQSITAFMLGLESKLATFKVQRQINDYQQEALQAILPGATLLALWQIMGDVENLLLLISVLVLAGALFGMSNMLLVSMRERRYELAILRAIGAGPWLIFVLLQLEAMIITLLGIAFAGLALWLATGLLQDTVSAQYGLFISGNSINIAIVRDMGLIMLASVVVALIPWLSAYRYSLHTKLSANR